MLADGHRSAKQIEHPDLQQNIHLMVYPNLICRSDAPAPPQQEVSSLKNLCKPEENKTSDISQPTHSPACTVLPVADADSVRCVAQQNGMDSCTPHPLHLAPQWRGMDRHSPGLLERHQTSNGLDRARNPHGWAIHPSSARPGKERKVGHRGADEWAAAYYVAALICCIRLSERQKGGC